MQMLSEDDLNLRSASDEELEAAWDLWFDLAQETNAFDPAYSHGVLVGWTPGIAAGRDAGAASIRTSMGVSPSIGAGTGQRDRR